ncbi:hypothetical protein Cgig2_009521 [Carnegiea gigantea]|uniref:Uncharacterized protein n=1 Tax=Carnegiea gigantea TaxID=171969 RepID=A0A9Q1GSY3_9CARY|nr:hypothetical protein Cgig2_009521 [Carnegiea gigantea]
MLLKEAEKLGVLHGPRLRSLEVALTKLSASCPLRALPEDFDVLRPYFSLAEAEAAAAESELPRIVQATFYAMLLNDMLEFGAVHEYTVGKMRSVLLGLGWSTFEAWMRIMGPVIWGAQLYRQPDEVEVKEVHSSQGGVLGRSTLRHPQPTRSNLSLRSVSRCLIFLLDYLY